MKIQPLNLVSNNSANQNEVFGKVSLSRTPTTFLASRPAYRYLKPSVRGDQRKGLTMQGKRYID